jgi:hypothetical protein
MSGQASDSGPKPSESSHDPAGTKDSKLRILVIEDLPDERDDSPPALTAGADWAPVLEATAVAIYSKAFLETLGKRTADGVADSPKRVGDLVRRRIRRKGEIVERHISTGDERAAIIVVTDDLPDEARLALLDLDVTDEAVRGKLLRWDSNASAWRPGDES